MSSFKKNLFNVKRQMDNLSHDHHDSVHGGLEAYAQGMDTGVSPGQESGLGLRVGIPRIIYRRNLGGELGRSGFIRDVYGPLDNGNSPRVLSDAHDRYGHVDNEPPFANENPFANEHPFDTDNPSADSPDSRDGYSPVNNERPFAPHVRDRYSPIEIRYPFANGPNVRDRYVADNSDGYGLIDDGNPLHGLLDARNKYSPPDNRTAFNKTLNVTDRNITNDGNEHESSLETENFSVNGCRAYDGNTETSGGNRDISQPRETENDEEDNGCSLFVKDKELAKIQSPVRRVLGGARVAKATKSKPRRGMNRSKEDVKPKSTKAVNDPENILIVNLKDQHDYGWGQIAEELNNRRIAEGKRASFTPNSIQNRYNRNAPQILGVHGLPFVPVSQRKKGGKTKEVGVPPIAWNAQLDGLLTAAVKEVDSQRWPMVAALFTEKSGIDISAYQVAMRAEHY